MNQLQLKAINSYLKCSEFSDCFPSFLFSEPGIAKDKKEEISSGGVGGGGGGVRRHAPPENFESQD